MLCVKEGTVFGFWKYCHCPYSWARRGGRTTDIPTSPRGF